MDGMDDAMVEWGVACLPPFVTAPNVADKLGWAPSLQRHFREHVKSNPIPGFVLAEGEIYESIAELLRLPAGLASFEARVSNFDAKRRGLLKGLFEGGQRSLPANTKLRPRTPFRLMSALVKAEVWDQAAWMAWAQLEMPSGDVDRSAAVQELVEEHEELALRLSDYWTRRAWLRGSNDATGQSPFSAMTTKESTDEATLKSLWREEIDGLVRRLDDAPIGEDLEDDLAAWSQRLAKINLQWAELGTAGQAHLQAAMAALEEVLSKAVPPLEVAGRPAETFLSELAERLNAKDFGHLNAVQTAVETLGPLVEEAVAAVDAADAAQAAAEQEDSEEADQTLTAARRRRREAMRALKAYANGPLAALIEPASFPDREGEQGLSDRADDGTISREAELVLPPESLTYHHEAADDESHPVEEYSSEWLLEGVASATTPRPAGGPELTLDSRGVHGEHLPAEPQAKQPPPIEAQWSASHQDAPSDHQSEVLQTPIDFAIVQALISKRYGLAYHLAAAAQARNLGGASSPPVIFEALAVGVAAGGARLLPAATHYKRLQEDVLLAMDATPTPQTRLMVFAGALRPALFAPDSSGVEILGKANLGEYGRGLHELCQFVGMEIRGRGLNLSPSDFEPATADGDRRAAAEAARKTLIEFAATAPNRRLKFHRAIIIWTHVFRQGPIADAINAIKEEKAGASMLARAAEHWIYDDTAEHRVDLLDELHRNRKDRPLEAGVRLRLADWLRQTASHLRHWVEADEARGRTQGEHIIEKLHELRRHLAAAQADLEGVASEEPDLKAPVQAAVDVINGLFADPDVGESALPLDKVLGDDLLLFEPPILRRGANERTAEDIDAIIQQGPTIASADADFVAAFNRLSNAGRFSAARQVLERLRWTGADQSALEQALKSRAEDWSIKINDRAERLRGKADDLLGADQMASIDVGLSTRLDGLLAVMRGESRPEDTQLDFAELGRQLDAINADVSTGFEILLIPLREKINELKARGRNTEELEDMAGRHDLATLSEHIEAGLNDVDWTVHRHALLEQFAGRCLTDQYERIAPNQRSMPELIAGAQARRKTMAADFSELDGGEAEQACELLTAWRDLRAPQGARERALARLMLALGFSSADLKDKGTLGKAQDAPRRLTLQTNKIADRDVCRVPAFGSEANGRYEIILADPSAVKTGEELTGWLDQLSAATTTPTFLIVAGHLPLKSRNLFMTNVRRRGGSASCGLIDESMVVFLAAQPNRRRGHLFDLALPMGLVQPYADTAARTSREMFYGRKRELDDLWDRNGSCLVYGGRQLGKTALLKQIQLRHNDPPAQLVIYGDLQAELPDANGNIWIWLGRKLKGEPGFGRDMKNQAEVEAAIREWLSNDRRRRLLVLVDEADEFLRQELVNQYSSLAKIRDLMQATDRYCKFVFAGLHDVQRLARTPNSPLLHFGAPVRVGPLMGIDLPEARAMAEGPMASAGFIFEKSSLTGRMLSQVGYYPSLLQAFAKGLIERMNKSIGKRPAPVGGSLLPLKVSERDLEETFQDRAFRDNIQLKFENTLNLDERYRLITFVMLVDSLARRDQGALPTGLKDAEVQRLALDWWPQGFAEDQSLDAFQGLLQEMIGLGVLIEQADGRFVIRSARIADMLGGREQIEQKLIELSDKEALSHFDTGALRRLCGSTPSPLTPRQETMLLSEAKPASAVHLLASSPALGVDQVGTSLLEVAENTAVKIDRRNYQNQRQFEQAIEAAAAGIGQRERGVLVLSGPWLGPEMTVFAARNPSVRQAQRDGRYGMRVLLVPYEMDWRALDAAVDADDVISLSPLGESSLRQFVKQNWTVALDDLQAKDLHRLTGGFPRFLHEPKAKTAGELLESLRRRAEDLYLSSDLFTKLGLIDETLVAALTVVAEVGYDAEASDELMRGEGIDEPGAAVRQLERLGIVERRASQTSYKLELRLNPFVEAALARRKD